MMNRNFCLTDYLHYKLALLYCGGGSGMICIPLVDKIAAIKFVHFLDPETYG
jgi:hypothetical protein